MRYAWFGTSALLLQLVPVLSMLFLLTTAAGSALWVVRLERARKMMEEEQDGDQRPLGEADEPPPYQDESG